MEVGSFYVKTNLENLKIINAESMVSTLKSILLILQYF